MSFGEALALLKAGRVVSRAGWNGKGMFVFLVSGCSTRAAHLPVPETSTSFDEWDDVRVLPYLALRTVSGDVVPWLASQTDLLADDWSEAFGNRVRP